MAGCATALTAARHGIPVSILHAGSDKNDCNSYWAQGGVIYRNYRLLKKNQQGGSSTRVVSHSNHNIWKGDKNEELADTPLSLVNDIRIASGYQGPLLQSRGATLEEGTYSSYLAVHNGSNGGGASFSIASSSSSSSYTGGGNNSINRSSGSSSSGCASNHQHHPTKLGHRCPTSGVHWNEDAAWKLALEGPSRVRQLLLGKQDDGRGDEYYGCVVPFDRTTSVPAAAATTSTATANNNSNYGNHNNSNDVLSLCLEASHAVPRIIHHADCTGKVITTCITQAAYNHPLINFVGDAVVTDLILNDEEVEEDYGSMVIGAQVLDKRTNQVTNHYATHGVVLASGGLAGIYEHSTNPLGFNALGSSVALALRMEDQLLGGAGYGASRGGIVSDLEYVQFHPTSLFLPNESRFLLTEALRGEGAILRDGDGRAFARDYHPEGELAPRDIVARAVFCESQKATSNGSGSSPGHNAYLDITHRDGEWLQQRFPSIHHHLMSRSNGNAMDFTKEWMPVIPAAHYTCGGVTTDLSGRVVPHRNLYAAGEAARTGLHGGNRLASTSLLEGLVFGASVGEVVAGFVADTTDMLAMQRREDVSESIHRARYAIEQRLVMERRQSNISASSSHGAARTGIPDDKISRDALSILANLKSLMWENVGVVRTPAKLADAVSELSAICDQADRLWMENGRSAGWEVVALRDASRAGLAVAESALANRVSGGAHYVVLDDDDEEEAGRRKASKGSERKEQDSEGEEDDVLVVARA